MNERSLERAPGSGRERRVSETRRKILEAAERLIEAKGLARVTTRDIAREAGVADGTLYVHFPNKEDLFLAVVGKSLPGFAAALGAEHAGERTLEEELDEVARAAIDYFDRIVSMSASLFADAGLLARQQAAMEERGVGPHLLYERVAAYVETEQRAGRVDGRLDPLGVAALLLGPCFQYVFLRRFVGRDPLPTTTEERFIRDLVRTLIAGLTPREG